MDMFYKQFEERFYAPRDVIKKIRYQYLKFITPLITAFPGSQAFDAGCGRGEWMELLEELGFSVVGADLDAGMLAECEALKLNAINADAVSYISNITSESQMVVTAFHVIEHISFDQWRLFINESLRVLKPGGLMILETPNPENITVATRNFYIDPTHLRPIPPLLLAYVAEQTGFARAKIIRLQEDKALKTKKHLTLEDVFSGVSPDYAIVCQKHAAEEIMCLFDEPFSEEWGLSIQDLFKGYEARSLYFEDKVVKSEVKNAQLNYRLKEILENSKLIESRLDDFEARLNRVNPLSSWGTMTLLRWTKSQLQKLRADGFMKRFKALLKKVLRKVYKKLSSNPAVLHKTVGLSKKFGVYHVMREFKRRLTMNDGIEKPATSNQFDVMTHSALEIRSKIDLAINKQD